MVPQAGRRPHVAKLVAVDAVDTNVDAEQATGDAEDEVEHRQSLERLYELSAAETTEDEQADEAAFESLIGDVDELSREADDMMSQALQIPQLMHEVQELTKTFEDVSTTERATRQAHRGLARAKRR